MLVLILKFIVMKRKFFAFALLIAAFVSVTSGCYVGYGYPHRYHHDRYYNHDRDRYDHRY
ncbi:MAG: hypothetical protein JWQ06_805 [Mucilaginibacter sp.]|jgi:hypothetical protein|nr:hypothetical protein [Mucilaginibacter sp.]